MITAAATADAERILHDLIMNLIVAPQSIAASGSPRPPVEHLNRR
jgi:hypothetical protein